MSRKNMPTDPTPRKRIVLRWKSSAGRTQRLSPAVKVSVRSRAGTDLQIARCRTYLRDGFEKKLMFEEALTFVRQMWRSEVFMLNDAIMEENRLSAELPVDVIDVLERDWHRWHLLRDV